MSFEGIYTAYLTGTAGQGMAMFVFAAGKISGADIAGLVFSGSYVIKGNTVEGLVEYRMPSNSLSITGATFARDSEIISVPITLPTEIDEQETYRIETPIGPLNAKFVKNTEL
ncbi:hypothetical protein [Phaeobacter inhibens]|uniref:Uncharacterized protein n=1 Tax=Phaeobacter inhibens TaxID=221822 RepID=A0A2I7KBX3_9RHOB|nr:hypothetical protein [Phaeobacter inhibens]AUR00011.1 hypothetical protein PhaeoP88_02667 [Phaeobacter inhibens]